MSNTTFKSVKSVAEPFSELAVTKDVTVHQRLYVKDLITTSVFNIPGDKSIQSKSFTFTASGSFSGENTALKLDETSAVQIVAAEITHNGGTNTTSTVSVGTDSNHTTNIFNAAPTGTNRVSSAFSQTLGSNGSAAPVTLADNTGLFVGATGDISGIKLTVHYYI
jgi:hypothetical protein